MKFKTVGEAVLALAGIRALAQGQGVLRGMRIDPGADGKSVWLRCGEHMVEAEIPPGMDFDTLMTETDWFNLQSPLDRMPAEGNA